MSRKVEEITRIESDKEKEITNDLDELQMNLDYYAVKYPDERTINSSVEQLRIYVPHKKHFSQKLFAQLVEAVYHIFPIYRFTSIGLFFFGSLLLPNKLY
jgi:hypothetical protein